jgi:hypothetical protein
MKNDQRMCQANKCKYVIDVVHVRHMELAFILSLLVYSLMGKHPDNLPNIVRV